MTVRIGADAPDISATDCATSPSPIDCSSHGRTSMRSLAIACAGHRGGSQGDTPRASPYSAMMMMVRRVVMVVVMPVVEQTCVSGARHGKNRTNDQHSGNKGLHGFSPTRVIARSKYSDRAG